MDQELNNIDFQDLRDKAYMFRYDLFENLEKHLLLMDETLQKNNVKVYWAQDEQTLCNVISESLPQISYNTATVDMDNVPAMFDNFGNTLHFYPIKDVIDNKQNVDTLIVNADYAISSTGEMVFIDRKSQNCFNKIGNLIVVLNIDQVIANHEELDVFLYLKKYVNPANAPHDIKFLSRSFEKITPEEFPTSQSKGYTVDPIKVTVIFYENNVIPILRHVRLKDALFCIKCGKCKEVCPVAKAVGGQSPIDLIRSACLDPSNRSQEVFKKTTLCGNCKEACPIGINFTDLFIYLMNMINEKTGNSKSKKVFNLIQKRAKLNKYNSPIFRWLLVKKLFSKNKTLIDYFKSQKDTFYNIASKDNSSSNSNEFLE